MLQIKHHFLDTNMVLAIPFKNDYYHDCVEYYKLNYERYISYNVEKEVFNVTGRLRLITIDVFNHIKSYITSRNIALIKIDYHIQIIKNTYQNKFTDKDYVFGIKKEKFLSITDELFITYYEEIKNTILNNDTNLDLLTLKSKNAFKEYNKSITNCMVNFEKFSFENNQTLIDKIVATGIHEKDAILVEDCFNKAKDMNEKFVFVTQDKDIIECSKDAFKLLNSKVYFSNPVSFLNN